MAEPNLEQEITNIFITIDNYGTAEEARVDIRKLIANQVREARIDELDQLIQRIKEEVIGKKREPSNSNSSFDLYLYATNEGYNQAIDEVNQILETIMNRSSYDR